MNVHKFSNRIILKKNILFLRPPLPQIQKLKSGHKSSLTISELRTPAKGHLPFEQPDCRIAW
jgi:hypothetical protein